LDLYLGQVDAGLMLNDKEEVNQDKNCSIAQLFNQFQVFADTLKELVLLEDSWVMFSGLETVDFTMELPMLERLVFKRSTMIKIDYLLNLTSLKYLQVYEEEGSNMAEYAQQVFERMPSVKKVVIWRANSENGKQVYRRQ